MVSVQASRMFEKPSEAMKSLKTFRFGVSRRPLHEKMESNAMAHEDKMSRRCAGIYNYLCLCHSLGIKLGSAVWRHGEKSSLEWCVPQPARVLEFVSVSESESSSEEANAPMVLFVHVFILMLFDGNRLFKFNTRLITNQLDGGVQVHHDCQDGSTGRQQQVSGLPTSRCQEQSNSM